MIVPDASPLAPILAGLTVGQIMVPRARFATAAPNEPVAAVRARNAEGYCHWPVADADGHVTGLLRIAHAPDDAPVSAAAEPLGEPLLLGADAPVIAFAAEADTAPFRFVVAGARIAGLVTTSDLQRLPVRAALFALVTRFEIAMAAAIEARLPDPDTWVSHLTENRREKLRYNIAEMRAGGHWVTPTLATQFVDKVAIIRHLLPDGSRSGFRNRMRDALKLRDQLAHAGAYAATPDQARRTAHAVRALLDWLPQVEALA